MMALDDVVHVSARGPRVCVCVRVTVAVLIFLGVVVLQVEEACERTTRWIDRCIAAHKRPEVQNLFGIVQGGLQVWSSSSSSSLSHNVVLRASF